MIASGVRVAQYEILSPIGSGAMGQVYLAVDHTLGRQVAMKFVPPELASDERAGLRLVQEARAAARLDHPNICAIHEIGEDGGRRFIVMQFIEGETLAARLQRGPLEPSDAIPVAIQVASALSEAHARGIVHRDIKPQNIMLTPRGQVRVLDFGIATAAATDADETATRLTTPGMVVGTWPFMSPEQVRGEELDGRSDIFSLGVVLFEAVWGFHPFRAASGAEIVSNILTRDPLPADAPEARRAPALVPIVRHCLEKDRSRRYQSADELAVALELARKEPPIGAPRASRRRALAVALVLALLALAGSAVGAVLWSAVRARSAAPSPPAVAAGTRTDSAAYDAYLRARVKLRMLTRDNIDAAIRLLQGAVAADPTLAPAHAELARASIYKAFQFSTVDEQRRLLEDAEVDIEKALALNPNRAEAYLARGLVLWTKPREFPHDMAIRAFRRAIALDPNLDEAHHELAVVYMHVGLLEQAWDEIQRTLAINPDNTLARVRAGTIKLYGGDYAQAVAIIQGVPEEANPAYRSRALADGLFRLGREREAAELVDDYLKRNPADEGGSMTSVKALLLAHAGKRQAAEEAIRRAIEIGQTAWHFHHTAYNVGGAYAMLGKHDEAVHWLQAAVRDGFPCYPFFEKDWTLDPLRHDPAFESLLNDLRTKWEGYKQLK